jgi:anti-sigma factor RsiW
LTQDARNEIQLLLNAAVDGELDAAGTMEIERCMEADPALAGEYRRLMALRDVIQLRVPRERAPDELRQRIAKLAQSPVAGRAQSRLFGGQWRSMAAAAVIVLMASSGYLLYGPQHTDNMDSIMQAVAAGYMRAQVSGTPVDVASSDRHTVKPWLGSKVPLATAAVDLNHEGFPLAGGRIDIVGGKAVPTLVYKRREHYISVTELIVPGSASQVASRRATVAGYSMSIWQDNERTYLAVSDVSWPEMEAFVEAFRRGVAQEQ